MSLGPTGLFCECDPFPLGKSFVLKTNTLQIKIETLERICVHINKNYNMMPKPWNQAL